MGLACTLSQDSDFVKRPQKNIRPQVIKSWHKTQNLVEIFINKTTIWISTRSISILIVDISSRFAYNTRVHQSISTRTMYDDFDLDYTNNNEYYTYDLDDVYEICMNTIQEDTYDLDDEYSRDSYDYQDLAYRHYAWYNTLYPIRDLCQCSCTQNVTYRLH